MAELNEVMSDSEVSSVSEVASYPEPIDYSSYYQEIIDNQNIIIGYFDNLDAVTQTLNSAVLTYSIIFVPLLLLTGALWWFFKQFIR